VIINLVLTGALECCSVTYIVMNSLGCILMFSDLTLLVGDHLF